MAKNIIKIKGQENPHIQMQLSCQEQVVLEEHERLSPHLLFEIIRRDGDEELARPTKSLVYSGFAAGIVISFSFLFKAVLTMYLPHAPWSNLITSIGYTAGFIIVILGRMQLFTENTITTVIPLFKDFSGRKIVQILRLWGLVFLSNLLGTLLAALFLSSPAFISPELTASLHSIALHVVHMAPMQNIVQGIPAGILIAAIVWMMPMSQSFSFFLILFFTYFISLGGFAHVVVGSCELAYEVLHGGANLYDYFFRFLIPTGIGNIIGGTIVFTLLVYAQVSRELK
ncbi:formate/nitrite transporter family protein [Pectinatus sottacetonis]|uniref:formate/nitrite transporter family protein n=1 Tax=Pectinatus sottacetonis TaxID=1002795 RepID=UPI0018C7B612|nr:formate/nitrite transporter family protein [Pectinatus sottacetonis]